MKLIDKKIKRKDLKKISLSNFGLLIKAVIDINKEIIVVGGEMHADEEKYLLENGSKQTDLWGINLYPDLDVNNFIEFDSMINVRPSINNFSRGIENKEIQKKIITIVNKLIS